MSEKFDLVALVGSIGEAQEKIKAEGLCEPALARCEESDCHGWMERMAKRLASSSVLSRLM
jgi:hypothetical protein